MVAIPAHDEAAVIQETIHHLQAMDYPVRLFEIHVVADYCTDNTAIKARQAGAIVHERSKGLRTGKGAALSWLFKRVLNNGNFDGVVVFDADTLVAPDFLRVMDTLLAAGENVIQGRHVIRNPEAGWLPALSWAMFMIDNRFQNLGRSNLGWSAKNMGDSICFQIDVLRRLGWGDGLTDDYDLRQRMLLEGIKIRYEPDAAGFGEAPRTWSQARSQRARWLGGTVATSNRHAEHLLVEAVRQRDGALLDGALQAYLPSYSTLTVIGVAALLIQILINWFFGPTFSWKIITAWTALVAILISYPVVGLALERAPLKAYVALLLGPFFLLLRTWLAVSTRLGRRPATWIRTAHGDHPG